MFGRVLGTTLLAITLVVSWGSVSAGDKDKKFEIPKDAIAAKVKSVNHGDMHFTVTLKDDKEKTFKVDKETKFFGPRGGLSEDGIKDDRLVKGAEVHVLADKSGKVAREVYLPYRKKTEKDKK